MKKLVVVTDRHIPFDDPAAASILNQFLGEFKPDLYVEGGDFLDCYQLSRFDRDPQRRMNFAKDITTGRSRLRGLEAILPETCRKVFLEGNHEDRFRKFTWDKVPELADLDGMSLAEQLHLQAHGWEHIPYADPVAAVGAPGLSVYGLLIMHGLMARKHSGATARAHFERFLCNGISGHSHRQGRYYHRAWGGEYTWLEAGCMCQLEPPYMSSPDWQQGWAYAYIHDSTSNPAPRFELHEAVVHNRKMSWEGRLFHA
jgi:hypothetical protein